MLRNRRERAHSQINACTQVTVHRLSNIKRAKIARNIATNVAIRQVGVISACFLSLQNLGAQVAHSNAAFNRICAIYSIFKQNVRVARLKLNLRKRHKEFASINVLLVNARICNHLIVMLSNRNVCKRLAIFALNVVRAKQSHLFLTLSKLKSNIWNHNTQRKRLNTNLLVRVLALSVKETHNIWVVSANIHGTSALTSAKLISIRE